MENIRRESDLGFFADAHTSRTKLIAMQTPVKVIGRPRAESWMIMRLTGKGAIVANFAIWESKVLELPDCRLGAHWRQHMTQVTEELRQHILHMRRELTRQDRSPWHVRQKLAVKVSDLLAASDEKEACQWQYDEDTCSFDTACGSKWLYGDGTSDPADHGQYFCHHCGKNIGLLESSSEQEPQAI
ncbi:TPA: hypothetical protein L4R50_000201 [Pseudomonas aeruginosa]|nr:hypothetical protein [Pseudomonas aeruginosa]